MYYKCHDCDEYFEDDEMETKHICLENEYGVGGMFESKHYSDVGCCPHCRSIEIEEVSDWEMVDEIEDLRCEINRLKKIIKELKNDKCN
ncbi:hypothetical protein IKJ53_01120 [bacterium]|nr:hypothetical protein [bacterium]